MGAKAGSFEEQKMVHLSVWHLNESILKLKTKFILKCFIYIGGTES